VKKIFIALSFVVSLNTFCQLANQNTIFYAQKDEHGNGYSALWGYAAPNGREYAILGCNTGTAFIDITDTANIHEVDFVTGVNSGWREMKVFFQLCLCRVGRNKQQAAGYCITILTRLGQPCCNIFIYGLYTNSFNIAGWSVFIFERR
jgi:hypothetical protein